MSINGENIVFDREKRVKVPTSPELASEMVFAVCLKTDDEKLLIPFKVYKIKLGGNRACLIDEAGEVAVYPMDFFHVLSLLPVSENALAEVIY
jgi:hypothetical protein